MYLLRGQSLSAVENARDLAALAAGLDAMSSASSYPELFVGKGDDPNSKYSSDNAMPETDTLNPDYFRTYFFTADFPSDWQLSINIMSKSSWFDSVIGSTSIDIEDRYYGNPYIIEKKYLEYFKDYLTNAIENEQEPQ